jgi:hypothetical protein
MDEAMNLALSGTLHEDFNRAINEKTALIQKKSTLTNNKVISSIAKGKGADRTSFKNHAVVPAKEVSSRKSVLTSSNKENNASSRNSIATPYSSHPTKPSSIDKLVGWTNII